MDFPPKSILACLAVIVLGLVVHFERGPLTQRLTGEADPPTAAMKASPIPTHTPSGRKEKQRTHEAEPSASASVAQVAPAPAVAPTGQTPPDQGQPPAEAPPTPAVEAAGESGRAGGESHLRCLAPLIEHERVSGKDRFATAIAVSKLLYEARSERHVVLASGANFPDAIAALNLSKAGDATPILLTPAEGLTPFIEAELRRIATKDAKVTIIGGPTVISDAVVQQIQTFGYQVERIHGQDRVETALKIADTYPKRPVNQEFVVTPADDYALSLVGGALAANHGGTQVLSPTDPKANNPVYGWIHDRNPYQITVLGDGISTNLANRSSQFFSTGQAPVVPTEMNYPESGCKSSTDLLPPGPGQQTVAERVMLNAFRDATDIIVVDADSPVDGIAAGQMAAQYNAPILPLYRDINHINRYVGLIKSLGAKERMIHFVGGKKSISEEVRNHFITYLAR